MLRIPKRPNNSNQPGRPGGQDTSWEKSAGWYDTMLSGEGTYQKQLILPNLMRLVEPKKGMRILDLACGQGFFANELAPAAGRILGVDASPALIEVAKKKAGEMTEFRVGPADDLSFIKNKTFEAAIMILAVQNIDNVKGVFAEVARVLKPGGTLHIVMNHPAFRIPRSSDWGWDEAAKIQYRRVDSYLSEAKIGIVMHPSQRSSEETITFHRPLQYYFKLLPKAGFAVTRLEEWSSHKKSNPGPRSAAEDKARKEIPLFLYLAATLQK